jgi:quercetin dioxygenase-like cupin family protein
MISKTPMTRATEQVHDRPPERMKPGRAETMNPLGSGITTSPFPGVHEEWVVGTHNRARNLASGFITIDPDTQTPGYRHHVGQSLTVLSGELSINVEGRQYQLAKMDNVVVPRGLAHQLTNPSKTTPVVMHVSMSIALPTYSKAILPQSVEAMPESWIGIPRGERINRYATAPRYEACPNVTFIDHFNRNLIPDIEMSGGYGLFQPGGRLPAHLHDFDESICIIEGEATCLVESRRYTMSDCNTALQPRGRVHYFINNTQQPMAMLWVYAGPRPERVVVDERCAQNPTSHGPTNDKSTILILSIEK